MPRSGRSRSKRRSPPAPVVWGNVDRSSRVHKYPAQRSTTFGSQTAKVFEGEFKGFHIVLNLITGRHNSHKRNLRFPEPDSGACRDRTFLKPLFVPLDCVRVGSDPLAIDHKRQ